MKTVMILLFSLLLTMIIMGIHLAVDHTAPIPAPDSPVEQRIAFESLLDAIEWVESRGNASAVGDNGDAIGAYQIHKIYVDDCNRILGYDKFHYEDRWDRDKSRDMIAIVIQHYGNGKTLEQAARIHNGGPNGWKKKSTENYWKKVKKFLDTQN